MHSAKVGKLPWIADDDCEGFDVELAITALSLAGFDGGHPSLKQFHSPWEQVVPSPMAPDPQYSSHCLLHLRPYPPLSKQKTEPKVEASRMSLHP